LGERREGVGEWYPPVNLHILYNSQCVLEEIQEPDRKKSKKFGKSKSNDVLGFLKDFVNQQEQKNEKEAERREKMHDEKMSAMNKLIRCN
jgi:hypothetical protein